MAAFFVAMTDMRTHHLAGSVAAAFLLAWGQLAAAQQPPSEIALAQRLADAGAPRLVLDRAERLQPSDRNAASWGEWERLRCSALAALERHAALVERAAALPANAPGDVIAACHTGAALAALALERPAQARRHAALALWQSTLQPPDVQALRRVVIDAYVAERRGDEAYRAMLRFQQDHRPLPREVLAAFVDGLLDCGMDEEALAWLGQLDDGQPAKLRLRLRAGLVTRESAATQARAALSKGGDAGYWRLLLDAAGDDAASPLRIATFEHRLDVATGAEEATQAAARRLWDAYFSAANATANKAGLLVGDDASWADYAGRRLGTEPELARAMFAHLAERAQSAATRHNAQLQLLSAYRSERLERVALRVFAAMFPDVDALDTQLRHHLGALADANGRHAEAARYWKDLPAPADMDGGEWLMRLSRSQWLSSAGEANVDAVTRYYASARTLPPAAMQLGLRYAEALTDRGEHRAAQRLLEALLPHVQGGGAARLLLALGRARAGAGDPAQAADAYLQASFAAVDAAAADARLQAGLALARAGYVRDARAQLQWVIDNGRNGPLADAARAELKRLQP